MFLHFAFAYLPSSTCHAVAFYRNQNLYNPLAKCAGVVRVLVCNQNKGQLYIPVRLLCCSVATSNFQKAAQYVIRLRLSLRALLCRLNGHSAVWLRSWLRRRVALMLDRSRFQSNCIHDNERETGALEEIAFVVVILGRRFFFLLFCKAIFVPFQLLLPSNRSFECVECVKGRKGSQTGESVYVFLVFHSPAKEHVNGLMR